MHRLSMLVGTLCVALLASGGAFAQVAADPDNPNEKVADTFNYMPYGENIKLEDAKKAAAAAVAEATKHKWPMVISVVNTAGDLVYFEKMDDSQNASIEISQHKARAAARFRRSTVNFERLLAKGPYFAYLSTLDGMTGSRGGNPIVVGGKIIGAIGVSGGSGAQDDATSQAGAAALK